MPRFSRFSYSEIAFVNYGGVVEVNGVVMGPVGPSESRKSFASHPYIKGVTEPLTHVLKKYDISVIKKTMNTLQQQCPAPKFSPSPDSQTNVVYKIPCANCSWCYIGETGRVFNTRKKEHIRNVKTAAKGSRIANHAWSHDHSIDFNNDVSRQKMIIILK